MSTSMFHEDHAADLKDPEYRREYVLGRHRIDTVDRIVNVLEEAREKAEVSKTALAVRVGMNPPAVRRLFTAKGGNPTIATLVTVATALGYQLSLEPLDDQTMAEVDDALSSAAPDTPRLALSQRVRARLART